MDTKGSAGLMDEPFWEFSLRTYGAPGVPRACLALQDEQGADVNMLLYCCWAGIRAGPLGGEAFAAAHEFSKAWSDGVVRPLRSTRRWMKTSGCPETGVDTHDCMQLREEIKAIELQAEKLQQQTLESLPLAAPAHGGMDAIAANLISYFTAIGQEIRADTVERLQAIVAAAVAEEDKAARAALARLLSEG